MAIPKVEPGKYDELLAEKKAWVADEFSGFSLPEIEVFESPKEHYRLRAEFRTWHDGDDLDYIMFEPGSKHQHTKLTECPMVSETIHNLMFTLLDEIRGIEALRRRLFQVDFLSTLSGEVLVSLLYHRPIDEVWEEEARKLREKFGIDIVGRSRKKKVVLDRDFVIEKMDINGREYIYKQVENAFSQPNGEVCRSMIQWALDASKNAGGDMVELYCGNGNFTLPLAQNFRRVVATEISKTSVYAAQYNIEANNIDNVDVVRISSEEFSQVLAGQVQKRRTKDLDLESCNFTTVLVDPPRAGLDDDTVKQVQEYDNIIYVSCNPETLKENLKVITQTHKIERFAIFDQFPYTHHLESGVFLTRI